MKKYSILSLIAILFLTSCTSLVQPNYIGVLQTNFGKNGKSDFSIQRGRVSDWA